VSLLIARAHAKLNLDLRVLRRREDGFHELQTIFQSLALHDVLVCTSRRGFFELRCDAPGVPRDPSNLVWQAAAALWRELGGAGEPRDVCIQLIKRIPLQAGLGGGSADAAATLRLLLEAWQGEVQPARLHALAAALGSDVPFFLHGGTCLGLGRGDELYPLVDAPARWVLITWPEPGVSTAEAYRWYDADGRSSTVPARPGCWPSIPLANDLELPVLDRRPDIAALKALVAGSGPELAAMSGSGSAVFGLYGARDSACQAWHRLTAEGRSALLTRTVGRTEYERRGRVRRR
jgi:4-diphosphocytidyl-2-C-methyl-D-erythritol kinase